MFLSVIACGYIALGHAKESPSRNPDHQEPSYAVGG